MFDKILEAFDNPSSKKNDECLAWIGKYDDEIKELELKLTGNVDGKTDEVNCVKVREILGDLENATDREKEILKQFAEWCSEKKFDAILKKVDNVDAIAGVIKERIKFLKSQKQKYESASAKYDEYVDSKDKKDEKEFRKKVTTIKKENKRLKRNYFDTNLWKGWASALIRFVPAAGIGFLVAPLSGYIVSSYGAYVALQVIIPILAGVVSEIPLFISRNKKNDPRSADEKKQNINFKEFMNRLEFLKSKSKEKTSTATRTATRPMPRWPVAGAAGDAKTSAIAKIESYDDAFQLSERLKSGQNKYSDVLLLDKAIDFLTDKVRKEIGLKPRLTDDEQKVVNLLTELKGVKDKKKDFSQDIMKSFATKSSSITGDEIRTFKQYADAQVELEKLKVAGNSIDYQIKMSKVRQLQAKSSNRYRAFVWMNEFNNATDLGKKNNASKEILKLYKEQFSSINDLYKTGCNYNELENQVFEFLETYKDVLDFVMPGVSSMNPDSINNYLMHMLEDVKAKENSQSQQNTR